MGLAFVDEKDEKRKGQKRKEEGKEGERRDYK